MALVTTSEAAEHLGVHPATLWRWQKAGTVTPAYVTPGGQARWALDILTEQLRPQKDDKANPAAPPRPELIGLGQHDDGGTS